MTASFRTDNCRLRPFDIANSTPQVRHWIGTFSEPMGCQSGAAPAAPDWHLRCGQFCPSGTAPAALDWQGDFL